MNLNLFKSVLSKERFFFEPTSKIDYVIVGLGNPGEKYSFTRHNAGLICAQAFLASHGKELVPAKGDYLAQSLKVKGKTVLTVFPTTYMNASGEALISIAKKYDLKPEQFIVIVDEYNFPLGKIHFKKGGSDGGHNGLTSIIESLKSADFYRLRIGIGKEFGPGELVDYVLSRFKEEEKPKLAVAIENSIKALNQIFSAGAQRAMSEINSEKLFMPKEEKKEN